MVSDSSKHSNEINVDVSKNTFNIKPLKKSKIPNQKYLEV